MGLAAPPRREAASLAARPVRAAGRLRHPRRSITTRHPGSANPDTTRTGALPATCLPGPAITYPAGWDAAGIIRSGAVSAIRLPRRATVYLAGSGVAAGRLPCRATIYPAGSDAADTNRRPGAASASRRSSPADLGAADITRPGARPRDLPPRPGNHPTGPDLADTTRPGARPHGPPPGRQAPAPAPRTPHRSNTIPATCDVAGGRDPGCGLTNGWPASSRRGCAGCCGSAGCGHARYSRPGARASPLSTAGAPAPASP